MKRFLTIVTLLAASLAAYAQKPALDHSVYDGWKSVGRPANPEGGEWVTYTINPQEGDGVLCFYNMRTGVKWTVERGASPRISADLKTAVFRIAPAFAQTRQAKIEKKKGDQLPKDTLGVMDLTTGRVSTWPMLKMLRLPDNFIGHLAFAEVVQDAPAKKGGEGAGKGAPPAGKGEGKGEEAGAAKDSAAAEKRAPKPKDNLYVLNTATLAIDTLKCVDNWFYSGDGTKMAYTTKPGKKDSTVQRGVWLYDFATGTSTPLLVGEKGSWFGSAHFNSTSDKVVFYAALDTAKGAEKRPDLYINDGGESRLLVSHTDKVIPEGWRIIARHGIQFRDDDSYLLFGICPIPREKDTTLVEFEQPRLDVWAWNDEYIQPQQKVNTRGGDVFTVRVDLADGRKVRLGDDNVPRITVGDFNRHDSVLVYSDKPYRVRRTWDVDPATDLYLVNIRNGQRRLLMEDAAFTRPATSADGAYTILYEAREKEWYLYTLATGKFTPLTADLDVVFWDEDHDTPNLPGPYAAPLWFEDSRHFLLRDRYDWWIFDAKGEEGPALFTKGMGRQNNVMYEYFNMYSNDPYHVKMNRRGIEMDRPVYFKTFNYATKQTGLAMYEHNRKKAQVKQLVEGPYRYDFFLTAGGKKPVYVYNRGNFESGANLWQTSDMFKTQKQLTDVNPQQREYNWGTVEMLKWETEDGITAEGLLFKPEDFNPLKKYPVIFYFYEKNSETLYNPRVPSPSRSTVNIPYFVSNGYLVFVPDIYYTEGHPGKSALRSILPACDMLCQYPWVDGENLAIQGQSWGGYQVAYMITQTNRFKAAGSGAPVANMTSAYGGVRWQSGLLRTMQYEKGQSRIGKDLWDGFDLYIENSPIFFVPNVTTPVLIMHNDADGAVPWWQGIEFYSALRRCGKQAWLLQYNDEEHNLRERRNAKDLSIRLAQFFGHFLKGEPMPIWMSRGIPAELKGIEYGYGYEEDKKADK